MLPALAAMLPMPSRITRPTGLLAALAALFLSGCSLLFPFDIGGLPCSSNGECRDGYVCQRAEGEAGTGKCVRSQQLRCEEECGPLEACVAGVCTPSCAGRACPAGHVCTGTGQCTPSDLLDAVGARCADDEDCKSLSLFCLRPFGDPPGEKVGVCTRSCRDQGDCTGGTTCQTFPNATVKGVKLCATEWFRGCQKEADCVDSELSCGVYSVKMPENGPLMACRARRREGSKIGTENCDPDVRPCVNGLCVKSGSGTYCTTPCSDYNDCKEVIDVLRPTPCTEVTLNPDKALGWELRTRPLLCLLGEKSLLTECSSPADCNADAAECRRLDSGKNLCTTPCGNDIPRCPPSSVCKSYSEGDTPAAEYCGPVNP